MVLLLGVISAPAPVALQLTMAPAAGMAAEDHDAQRIGAILSRRAGMSVAAEH